MRNKTILYNINTLKELYNRNINLSKHLKNELGIDHNNEEIIELMYEIQSGSYTNVIENNMEFSKFYSMQLSNILGKFINKNTSLLDIGTGEMTNLSLVLNDLKIKPKITFAFDISWSRIYCGNFFVEKHLKNYNSKLVPFVADIFEIPLQDNSIDLITSNHALEPNGGNLEELLCELFRVVKKRLVLFEPYYEKNSLEGKQRMDSLGYIKGLENVVKELGGSVEDVIKIDKPFNDLNPTYCFVILPPPDNSKVKDVVNFSVPGTDSPLKKDDSFLYSEECGVSFPIIKNIPVLKSNSKIYTSVYHK